MRKWSEDFAVNLAASAVWTAFTSGAVGAAVSVLSAWIPGVPPWAIVFVGLVAGVLVLEGLLRVRKRLTRTEFKKEVVRLRDVTTDAGLIVGKTFTECVIVGPAVLLAVGEATVVNDPTFLIDDAATEEAVYLPAEQGRKFAGVLGVERSRFRRCQFVRVTWVVGREQLEQWRKEGRIKRTKTVTEIVRPTRDAR